MNADGRRSEPIKGQRSCGPRFAFICVHLWLLPLLAGCELQPPVHSAALRTAVTPPDPNLATTDYWWHQPTAARTAAAADFTAVWEACRAEVNGRFFHVDREEYRLGLMTTEPVVSKQVFEPWRTDAVTLKDVAESTLGTVRRTIRFEVRRRADGRFEAEPKVLVERFASAERRLTTISQYHEAFSGARPFADSPDLSGDAVLEHAATEYWYPLRRDRSLERDLAESIDGRLRSVNTDPGRVPTIHL